MARARNKEVAGDDKLLSTPQEKALRRRVARAVRWRAAATEKPEKEVGGEVGATPEMTSKWVNGHATPTPYYLARMVEEWPLNGHWLLTGDGPMEVQPADLVRPSLRTIEELWAWLERVLPPKPTAPDATASDVVSVGDLEDLEGDLPKPHRPPEDSPDHDRPQAPSTLDDEEEDPPPPE